MCIYSVMYSVCMSIKMYYFRSFMIFFLILIALPTLKIYYKFGFTCVWVCAYVYKYLCVCKHIWEICVASPKKKKKKIIHNITLLPLKSLEHLTGIEL